MKSIKQVLKAGAIAALLIISAHAAPLGSGIRIDFVAAQGYELGVPVQDIFPGDLLIFTGKSQAPFYCEGTMGTSTPAGYITTVIVLDPARQRHPILVSIVTRTEVPAGTRASIVEGMLAGLTCAPEGYSAVGVAITN